jgi:hypothetical protein
MGIVAKVSEIHSTFIFRVKVSSYPEDEGSMYLRNFGHIANIYILQCAQEQNNHQHKGSLHNIYIELENVSNKALKEIYSIVQMKSVHHFTSE